jgi:hypothetical protein
VLTVQGVRSDQRPGEAVVDVGCLDETGQGRLAIRGVGLVDDHYTTGVPSEGVGRSSMNGERGRNGMDLRGQTTDWQPRLAGSLTI